MIGNLVSMSILSGYKNVLKRGYFKEFIATMVHCAVVTSVVIVFLYMVKMGGMQSKIQIFGTAVVYVLLSYILRQIRKKYQN